MSWSHGIAPTWSRSRFDLSSIAALLKQHKRMAYHVCFFCFILFRFVLIVIIRQGCPWKPFGSFTSLCGSVQIKPIRWASPSLKSWRSKNCWEDNTKQLSGSKLGRAGRAGRAGAGRTDRASEALTLCLGTSWLCMALCDVVHVPGGVANGFAGQCARCGWIFATVPFFHAFPCFSMSFRVS